MQCAMKRFSDLGSKFETSKYANIEMTMVAKMKLIDPPYAANNHVYFISQDQIGRESQSKKKETRAI